MDGSHLKMTFTWRCQKPCEDLRKTTFCSHRLIAIDSSKQKALDADSRKLRQINFIVCLEKQPIEF